ncbi:helix-turn-helix domain-containing protein [Merdimonas faecis]|uniref:helix-turn-helix domain-containing protein n=1 Tax=Merdimonas faecis TaxID=1653435 RepID=UPI0009F1F6D1|nr:helix-turn-helix transcriptional regulator [Merdimonas faecis]
MMEGIGKRIKASRISAGLTQERLAEKVGISSTYLSAIECSVKEPKLSTFVRIANAIGASADDLLADVLSIKQYEQYIEREERIRKLPLKEQNKIYRVLDVMIEEAEKE